MNDEFRKVKSLDDVYEVNRTGVVRNVKTRRVMKQQEDNCGRFFRHKKYGMVRIDKLVDEAFVPNLKSYVAVRHKDGNPTNNNADNLEWVDCSYRYPNKMSDTERYNLERKKSEIPKVRAWVTDHIGAYIEYQDFAGREDCSSISYKQKETKAGTIIETYDRFFVVKRKRGKKHCFLYTDLITDRANDFRQLMEGYNG